MTHHNPPSSAWLNRTIGRGIAASLFIALLSTQAASAEVKTTLLKDDFKFTEGPTVTPSGDVLFTDIPNNLIYRWNAKDGFSIFLENSGGANGLISDADGNLYICEGRNRQVTMIAPDGEKVVLADNYEGNKLNSPNDLWLDPKGGIYFTDPSYSKSKQLEQDGEHVYYISPDRKTLTRVVNDMVRPNGVIGTPDGKTLYIADHGAGKTYRYAIKEDGSLGDKALFVPQGSDGLSLDAKGNLTATSPKGADIYDSAGNHLLNLSPPNSPTNVTVLSESPLTLFITDRKAVYLVEVELPNP